MLKRIFLSFLILVGVLTVILIFFVRSIDILSSVNDSSSSTPIETLKFPPNFLFGVATASFQVEYDPTEKVDTNWSRFLVKHPKTISPGELGPEWWKEGNAEQDIDRFASLGVKSLRMSLEWARIEPKKGVYDSSAIKRYKDIIEYSKTMELEPMITIHHFTNPGWFDDLGGWEKKENVEYFLTYSTRLVKEFPDINYWVTINEPNVYVNNGYLVGAFPPEKQSIVSAFNARNNIVYASNETYKIIKKQLPKSQVGAAFNLRLFFPYDKKSVGDRFISNLANYIETINYIDATKDYADFIGVNYYTAYLIRFSPTTLKISIKEGTNGIPETLYLGRTEKPNTRYISEMGWPVYPEAFYDTLQIINKRYKKPIIITENGISDEEDKYRAFYLLTHFAMLQKALNNGIDIKRYYHWSGIDNLEWAEGYTRNFGLIGLDSSTGNRTIRDSAYFYKKIIQEKNLNIIEAIDANIKDEEQKQEARKIIGE